jgi:hypothetical protein
VFVTNYIKKVIDIYNLEIFWSNLYQKKKKNILVKQNFLALFYGFL